MDSSADQCDRAAPRPVFPLVRHLSSRITPLLLATSLSANQITVAAIALALVAAALFADGHWAAGVAGALCLVGAYVLDNCDGEVARARGTASRLGALLDDLGDWVTHAALFAAMGIGVGAATGEPWWTWCGWIAAAGATVNTVIAVARRARAATSAEEASRPQPGEGAREWLLFVLRELSRADFCFIVLALALADLTRVLLPAAAIGAQVYWISGLAARTREYHV